MKESDFDVAVIGGGLVGASFIRSLRNSKLRVLLIDRAAATDLYSPAMDNRGLAISYVTKLILEDQDLWRNLRANAFSIDQVHVSEQGSFGNAKLLATQTNYPALGYVVSASALGASLMQGLDTLADTTILRPATVTNAEYNQASEHWDITVLDQKFTAKLLVAADGSNSMLRKTQNFQIYEKDFQQTAIVTNVGISTKNLAIAFERFTLDGVLALLPFGNGQMKCVWTVANAQLAKFMHMSDAEFIAALQQSIGYRLGMIHSVEQRKSFKIVHTYAQQIIGESTVLLGNAANTLHPVAAQGFNLGVRDAVQLASLLKIAKTRGTSLKSVLPEYARMRNIDHRQTRDFCNSLVEIFANQHVHAKLLRGLSLSVAQLVPRVHARILARGLGTCV